MTYVRTHPLSVLPAHDYTLTTEDVEAEGIPFTTHTHTHTKPWLTPGAAVSA